MIFWRKDKLYKVNIRHNNIILDPGIGFGKNFIILPCWEIFLFFTSRISYNVRHFEKGSLKISGVNDSKERLGGTIISSLLAAMQGVQILRVHDVNEINQS